MGRVGGRGLLSMSRDGLVAGGRLWRGLGRARGLRMGMGEAGIFEGGV